MDIAVVIVAAGRSSRFGSDLPKQYCKLAGRSVLRWTVEAFLPLVAPGRIQTVIDPAMREAFNAAIEGLGLPEPCAGGATRQDSVRHGLEALKTNDAPGMVLVHDAARPLLDGATLKRVVNAIDIGTGAAAALPSADTLRRGDAQNRAAGLIDRTGVWRMQTPQGFSFGAIFDAHQRFVGQDFTDDVALAEQAGLPVQLVHGSALNFKITTQEDMAMAEALMAEAGETRTGTGFDVHAFGEGDAVTLCGVSVPHDRGLAGHSDADVGLHALVDALLGAIGEGDIGEHFPPSDPQWKGADSADFLRYAMSLLRQAGAAVQNVDLTLICERPKLGPYKPEMRGRVAALLGVEEARVNIKATTTEGLGFTGRREGIAAQAVATLRLSR